MIAFVVHVHTLNTSKFTTMPQTPTPLQLLIAHLASNPLLPAQLRMLHSLALYDSGDAVLGREEKEALQAVQQLADLLDQVPDETLRNLL